MLAFLQALVDEDKIPMKEQNVSNAVKEEGEQIPAGPPGNRMGQLSENLTYAVRLTTIDNRDKFPVNSDSSQRLTWKRRKNFSGIRGKNGKTCQRENPGRISNEVCPAPLSVSIEISFR